MDPYTSTSYRQQAFGYGEEKIGGEPVDHTHDTLESRLPTSTAILKVKKKHQKERGERESDFFPKGWLAVMRKTMWPRNNRGCRLRVPTPGEATCAGSIQTGKQKSIWTDRSVYQNVMVNESWSLRVYQPRHTSGAPQMAVEVHRSMCAADAPRSRAGMAFILAALWRNLGTLYTKTCQMLIQPRPQAPVKQDVQARGVLYNKAPAFIQRSALTRIGQEAWPPERNDSTKRKRDGGFGRISPFMKTTPTEPGMAVGASLVGPPFPVTLLVLPGTRVPLLRLLPSHGLVFHIVLKIALVFLWVPVAGFHDLLHTLAAGVHSTGNCEPCHPQRGSRPAIPKGMIAHRAELPARYVQAVVANDNAVGAGVAWGQQMLTTKHQRTVTLVSIKWG